jgi:predicted LPLAT superfamily acyltransferase
MISRDAHAPVLRHAVAAPRLLWRRLRRMSDEPRALGRHRRGRTFVGGMRSWCGPTAGSGGCRSASRCTRCSATSSWARHRAARIAGVPAAAAGRAPGVPACRPAWATAWRHFLLSPMPCSTRCWRWAARSPCDQITMQQPAGGAAAAGGRARRGDADRARGQPGGLPDALAELQPRLRLNILVHHVNAQKFNRMLERQGASQVRLIEVTEITPATAMELERRVAAGEMLVIAADRLTPGSARRSLAVPFLGARRALPAGPVHPRQPAALPGVPGLLHPPRRPLPHRFRTVRRAHRACPRRAGCGPAAMDRPLCRARRAEQCRQAPLQWFNFYPFWAPPG